MGENLEKLYSNRFSPEEQKRKIQVWKILCDQFFIIAVLDYLPAVKHDYPVALPDGRKPVGNDDTCALHLAQMECHFLFGNVVEGLALLIIHGQTNGEGNGEQGRYLDES